MVSNNENSNNLVKKVTIENDNSSSNENLHTILSIQRHIKSIAITFGSISGILSLMICLLLTCDIILRIFRVPFSGALEISRLMLGWVCFASLVYTYIEGEHVRVTILLERWSKKVVMVCNIIASIVALSLMLFLLDGSIPFFIKAWHIREGYNVDIYIPYWLSKFSVLIGSLAFSLAIFRQLILDVIALCKSYKRRK